MLIQLNMDKIILHVWWGFCILILTSRGYAAQPWGALLFMHSLAKSGSENNLNHAVDAYIVFKQ